MTKVLITKKDGHIISVDASGHSGFALEGEDIVCAALSSVIQTALLGLLTVAGINVTFKREDEEGSLRFTLPDLSDKDRYAADIILDTMTAGLSDLFESFSKFIKLKIVNG